MNIGFIGLGLMGSGMARNIQKAGHQLIVSDVRKENAEEFLAKGAIWADSPKDLAAQSEVVFTSLPGPAEMEAVALGEDGLIYGMRAGAAYFDLSTNAPSTVRRVQTEFAKAGIDMFDAPVSGGVAGAASGQLAIWAGGDLAAYERHSTVLADFSDSARYIGPIGSGTIAKLVHNCTGFVMHLALAEVFAMGVKAGLDPLPLWEAVRSGAEGRRRTFDGLFLTFFNNKYEPAGFSAKNGFKDLALATALGREVGVPMKIANLVEQDMREAMNLKGDHVDAHIPMLVQLERSGVVFDIDPDEVAAVKERAGL